MNIGNLDISELAEPRSLQLVGLDAKQHDFRCGFVQERGILPCSCHSDRTSKDSVWYRRWKRWSLVRINPGWWARHRDEPSWPIQVGDAHLAWIPGWDYFLESSEEP